MCRVWNVVYWLSLDGCLCLGHLLLLLLHLVEILVMRYARLVPVLGDSQLAKEQLYYGF